MHSVLSGTMSMRSLSHTHQTHTHTHTHTLTHTHTHTHTALEVVGANAAYLHYTYACSAYSSACDATSIHHSAPYAGARRPKGQAVLKAP